MAETISKNVSPGEVVEFYKAKKYARISVSAAVAGIRIGLSSSIPPVGNQAFLNVPILTSQHEHFAICVNDSVYISNTGAATARVNMLVEELPWPVEKNKNETVESAMIVNIAVRGPAIPEPELVYSTQEKRVGVLLKAVNGVGPGFRGWFDFKKEHLTTQWRAAPLATLLAGGISTSFTLGPRQNIYTAIPPTEGIFDLQAVISPCPWWREIQTFGLFF